MTRAVKMRPILQNNGMAYAFELKAIMKKVMGGKFFGRGQSAIRLGRTSPPEAAKLS